MIKTFSIFRPVRILFAKILLSLAVGLLFSHQFIAHHHHEDAEITSGYHYENEDADHHHDYFPSHNISHLFTFAASKAIVSVKVLAQDAELTPVAGFTLSRITVLKKKREYIEVRPPLIKYYKYLSLRAPPSLA